MKRYREYVKGLQLTDELGKIRCQFNQHFTPKFFVQMFVQSQTLGRENLPKRLSYEKSTHKTLMKLTQGWVEKEHHQQDDSLKYS